MADIVAHTLTVEINFYSFPVDAKKLAKAGVTADLAGSDGRLVFGIYTVDMDPYDVLFVERKKGDGWEVCSEEIEGDRVEEILSKLKVEDSLDLLAELRDGAEEQAQDSEDDEDDEEEDGEDGGGWEIRTFDDDEKLFVLANADVAKTGLTLLPGDGPTRVVFGFDLDGNVLFVERKNKWWRRVSDLVRGDAFTSTIKALGREDAIEFIKEVALEDAEETEEEEV